MGAQNDRTRGAQTSRGVSGRGVVFIASLAEGRCLSIDRDGEAKLMLAISQSEAGKIATNLALFQGVSFRVTLTPVKGA